MAEHVIGDATVEWDPTSNELIIEHPGGTTITLDDDGVVELLSDADGLITDADGTAREVYFIDAGDPDPPGAGPDDLILEETD